MKYEVSTQGYFNFIKDNKINATILFFVGVGSGVILMKLLKK